MTQLLYFQADLKILEPMEEEEYSTESSNEEDMQEDGEREGNAAESDVFKPVDVDPACLPKVGMIFTRRRCLSVPCDIWLSCRFWYYKKI